MTRTPTNEPGPTRDSLSQGTLFPGTPAKDDLLGWPVERLRLSRRAENCLVNAGIQRVGQLGELDEDGLLALRNFGRTCLSEVKTALASHGLVLGWEQSAGGSSRPTRRRAGSALGAPVPAVPPPHKRLRPLAASPAAAAARPNMAEYVRRPWDSALCPSTRLRTALAAVGGDTVADLFRIGAPHRRPSVASPVGPSCVDEAVHMVASVQRAGSALGHVYAFHLERAGLADLPISTLGPLFRDLQDRARHASVGRTLGDLAVGLDAPDAATRLSEADRSCLFALMDRMVDGGPALIPRTLGAVPRLALEEVPADRRRLVSLRFLGARTRRELATSLDLSAETVREYLGIVLRSLTRHWKVVLAERVGAVVTRIQAAGGFLHASDVEPYLDGCTLRTFVFVLHLAGHAGSRVWRDSFVLLPQVYPQRVVKRLREALATPISGRTNDPDALHRMADRAAGAVIPAATFRALLDLARSGSDEGDEED